eukprot:CAMPEP_0185727482 /NCGR_PEP_ID=MMETSP1171-20130828/3159_1 /TAXON_ID=374046 /ORGANISM="Helicotheca tamensis, Strain CCMP826" /LENGTH=593 /DNA_ID=CAMNT_0028396061 /DNA_START=68 /DNA_END=1849 /DNA_ORIENTATION=+
MKFFAALVYLLSQATFSESYYQPNELKSKNGKLEVTLEVGMLKSLDGFPYGPGYRYAPAYNGETIGPTLRVKPGDTLIVHLINNLDPVSEQDHANYEYLLDPANKDDDIGVTILANRLTPIGNIGASIWGLNYINIHFHGLHIPPKVEAIETALNGGESKTLTWQFPHDQEPGLAWFHDHYHGTNAFSYLASLYGFIVVEGTDNDITKVRGIRDAEEVFLMVGEAMVNEDGTARPTIGFYFDFEWMHVTNGRLASESVFNFEAGTKVLFRMASATVEPTITLSLPDHSFLVVARDGLPLPKPEKVDAIEISGGGRVEFLVVFDQPGTFVMKRAAWNVGINTPEICAGSLSYPPQGFVVPPEAITAPCLSYDKEQDALTINVLEKPAYGKPPHPLPKALPPYSHRLRKLAKTEPVDHKTITFDLQPGFPIFQIDTYEVNEENPFIPPGVGLGINERLWNPFISAGNVMANTCETWDVVSIPPRAEHPFHTHTANFQVRKIDGVDVEHPFWVDTYPILGSNITIHVCFDRLEAGDKALFHCHMPTHLDKGMAAFFDVVENPADKNNAKKGGGRKKAKRVNRAKKGKVGKNKKRHH